MLVFAFAGAGAAGAEDRPYPSSGATRSSSQTQPPPSPASAPKSVSIWIGYEVHRDHLRYAFENPSSFNTSFFVPHNFIQTYVANNQWLVGSARYPLLGDMMETELGLTPTRPTFASDLDTFFNPDGDVIVSGTAGDVSMHAVRFAQWSEGRLWGARLRIGYLYRRDMTEYHSNERIVTHSQPRSETRTPINTHETTISNVHEVAVGLAKEGPVAGRWRLLAGADISPVMLARLTTILPEKYPGQRILFQAKGAALAARVQLVQQRSRWPIALTAHYGRTWSYRASSQFDRDALQVGVRLGLGH